MAETVLEEKREQGNPMRRIMIEKVVVNISPGKPGEPLEKAKQVLTLLTGMKPAERRARKTIKEFGVRRREAIAAIVTLRGSRAEEFLERAFTAVGRKVKASSFQNGVFSFGVKEHIQFPGVKYDPKIGVLGMDICVKLCRPGFRVMYRRRRRSSVGRVHRITKEEAINFMRQRFGLEVV
ncbi:MAG: 50S ribosomal protein L5 [Candidatus Brockarchaeota archaeon]|nr:50S ribosomal protein L5 [Candidatus Brockarchaeota archaeon]MBO3808524.1 50S ribosomal protein L5 [Candidatus Brockarchaeota archaeon]